MQEQSSPIWIRTFWRRVLKYKPVFEECNTTIDVRKVLRMYFKEYKILASGAHAVVLQPPRIKTRVIRFSPFGEDYAGWWHFAKVCLGTTDIHLPKIYTMIADKDELHLAVMKKYNRHPSRKLYYSIEPLLCTGVELSEYNPAVHSLARTADFLRSKKVSLNDIHRGNIMLDGHTPIIIDPDSTGSKRRGMSV